MDCRAVDRHFGGFLHLCQENVLSENGKIGYETKTDSLSYAVPLYLRTGGWSERVCRQNVIGRNDDTMNKMEPCKKNFVWEIR